MLYKIGSKVKIRLSDAYTADCICEEIVSTATLKKEMTEFTFREIKKDRKHYTHIYKFEKGIWYKFHSYFKSHGGEYKKVKKGEMPLIEFPKES